MAAWDEFVAWRQHYGLPVPVQDHQMRLFAERKARWQAVRDHDGGHAGPDPPDPTWREGTARAAASPWGWLTCIMEEDATHGGAGLCLGPSGERHMVLMLRGGTGQPLLPRDNLPTLDTSHLTPAPPSYDDPPRIGDRHEPTP